MDDTIKKKFEFVRSDIKCDDITELATLSDVESIACACIKQNSKVEGCNLLRVFGSILATNGPKQKEWIKMFMVCLDEAEKILS